MKFYCLKKNSSIDDKLSNKKESLYRNTIFDSTKLDIKGLTSISYPQGYGILIKIKK